MGGKMTSKENKELEKLRDKLCKNCNEFCRLCFQDKRICDDPVCQNPPNVFRTFQRKRYPKFFFVFDKPHNNDIFNKKNRKTKDYIPIEIFDQRKIESELPEGLKAIAFEKNRSMLNFYRLLMEKMIDIDFDENLSSEDFHLTNVVKCDKCAKNKKRKNGSVKINKDQAEKCIEHFFSKELELLKPEVLVLFGKNPFEYLKCMMNLEDVDAGDMWYIFKASLFGKEYDVVRVPHTARISKSERVIFQNCLKIFGT
jgi:hypothetical protein